MFVIFFFVYRSLYAELDGTLLVWHDSLGHDLLDDYLAAGIALVEGIRAWVTLRADLDESWILKWLSLLNEEAARWKLTTELAWKAADDLDWLLEDRTGWVTTVGEGDGLVLAEGHPVEGLARALVIGHLLRHVMAGLLHWVINRWHVVEGTGKLVKTGLLLVEDGMSDR